MYQISLGFTTILWGMMLDCGVGEVGVGSDGWGWGGGCVVLMVGGGESSGIFNTNLMELYRNS